eukprot:2150204-Rhodomonas_salina.1
MGCKCGGGCQQGKVPGAGRRTDLSTSCKEVINLCLSGIVRQVANVETCRALDGFVVFLPRDHPQRSGCMPLLSRRKRKRELPPSSSRCAGQSKASAHTERRVPPYFQSLSSRCVQLSTTPPHYSRGREGVKEFREGYRSSFL